MIVEEPDYGAADGGSESDGFEPDYPSDDSRYEGG